MTHNRDVDNAFTGLEAAIVLIAFVVVASVFAYVILGAGFMTTQKSQEVIYSGIESVSSTMQLSGNMYGISTDDVSITMINFSVMLAAGSTPINFEKVAITFSDGSNLETLSPVTGWRSTSTTAGTWAITDVQSEKGSTNNLLEKGEQFTISAHVSNGIPSDSQFSLDIKPGTGASIGILRTTPVAIKTVNILY